MNICPNCGLATSGESNYCSNCGSAVQADFDPTPTPTPAPAPTVAAAPIEAAPVAPGGVKDFNAVESVKTFNADQTTSTATATATVEVIGQRVENHLVKAIIATVCCCMPFGIVAIIYASKVNTLIAQNDPAGALEASQKASLWGNLSIGMGALVQVIWAIIYAVFFMSAMSESGGVTSFR